jgi:hypothetical protein
VVSTTATAVVVIKAAASHARSVTVADLLIVRLHAAVSASVQVGALVSAQAAVIVQALANALVVDFLHAAVRLATVLTALRVTTALLIAKRSKMHVMTHVVSRHLHRIAL